jgi:hypothetical protein
MQSLAHSHHSLAITSHHVYDVSMSMNDKLLQAIKDVGDLRERVGAARAHLEVDRANLAVMESELAQREKEIDSLVRSSRAPEKPARGRTDVPAPTPAPRAAATPPRQNATDTHRPLALRKGSLATRIVALLNASPHRNFSTADMAQHFNIDIRQLYGTLSRLATRRMIERVSEGVFRAVRGGVIAA